MRYVHLAYGHEYDVVFENLNPTDVIICPASITLVGLVGMGVEKQSRNELILYSLSSYLLLAELIKDWFFGKGRKLKVGSRRKMGGVWLHSPV